MRVKFNKLDFTDRMTAIMNSTDRAIDAAFEKAAAQAEASAKLNAPWRDRTGNARRTLLGTVLCVPFEKKRLSVVGRMSYSPALELFFNGRYSILFPTILNNASGILKSVVNAVEGVKI